MHNSLVNYFDLSQLMTFNDAITHLSAYIDANKDKVKFFCKHRRKKVDCHLFSQSYYSLLQAVTRLWIA